MNQDTKKLHEDIQAFSGATGDSDIFIGLESTGIYHTDIYYNIQGFQEISILLFYEDEFRQNVDY